MILERIREDISVVFDRDPAARSVLEVLACYPGLHALWIHRISHWLWENDKKLSARFLSHIGRFFTGVEIHPGAKIGRRFFIDHGMGVVIGETAEVGEDCTIYHQVTLGGTSWERRKRHPTLGHNVVVGAGAKILGPHLIGDDSKIGAGSVVITEVPPHSSVVGVPGKITIKHDTDKLHYDINHTDMPDPVIKALECIAEQVHNLEIEVKKLKSGKSCKALEPGQGCPPEQTQSGDAE